MFKFDEMAALVKAVDEKFTAAGTNNPQFSGKKVLLLQGSLVDDSAVATMAGWRTEFLTQMGFAVPDNINAFARDHRAFIPRDRMSRCSTPPTSLIWTTESDEEQAALLADPAVQAAEVDGAERNVFTGKELAGAIAFSSPLSYPLVADQLPPALASALG